MNDWGVWDYIAPAMLYLASQAPGGLVQPTPLGPENWCNGAVCRNWIWAHNVQRTPDDVLYYELSWELDGNIVTGRARLSSRDTALQCGTTTCTYFTPFLIPPSTTFAHRYTVCAVTIDGDPEEQYCATKEWENR